eukprot:scaffold36500_cov29-Prasinocladus_malaysianus.AAC.1
MEDTGTLVTAKQMDLEVKSSALVVAIYGPSTVRAEQSATLLAEIVDVDSILEPTALTWVCSTSLGAPCFTGIASASVSGASYVVEAGLLSTGDYIIKVRPNPSVALSYVYLRCLCLRPYAPHAASTSLGNCSQGTEDCPGINEARCCGTRGQPASWTHSRCLRRTPVPLS